MNFLRESRPRNKNAKRKNGAGFSYQIVDCDDRDEAVLRVVFRAARAGFKSIIDVVLTPKKVRDGTYQTQVWSATSATAHVDDLRIMKDRSLHSQPN